MVFIHATLMVLSFPDISKCFICLRNIGYRFAHAPPLLTPFGIYQQRRAECDVSAAVRRAASVMRQSIFPDYRCTGIAQAREFLIRYLLPNFMRMLLVIYADRHQ